MSRRDSCILTLGVCMAIVPAAQAQQVRLFMAPDGEEASAPTTGNTSISMDPGTTTRMHVWIEDTSAPGQEQNLNAYQLIFQWFAVNGSSGSVQYVDVSPGPGESITIDVDRPDWVFEDQIAVLTPNFNETPTTIFGVFYSTLPGFFTVPAGVGIRYLTEFDIATSADACGVFEFQFNIAPNAPPLAQLFNENGANFQIAEFQQLDVVVSPSNGACPNPIAVSEGDTGFCTALDDPEPDVWFQYTPDCAGTVSVSTCDQADFDSNIEIYQGCGVCPPNNLVASNDDGAGCGGGTSLVEFDAFAGVCYTIRVDGSGAGTGSGVLSIESATCFIDATCRADGEINPGNECELCDPGMNMSDWSPVAGGTACTDDGEECTDNACDGAGACAATPVTDGTSCTEDGEECTINECLGGSCAATPVGDGTACTDSDGNDCTVAECAAGMCDQDVPAAAGTMCDDGNVCTDNDECDGAGGCAGALNPNCQDTCDNASVVAEGSTPGNNDGFGTSQQVSCAFDSGSDAWFVYTPPCDGDVKITTIGSAFDTVLTILDECGGAEIACDDDGGVGTTSAATIAVTAGEDYFIRLAGFGGASGDFLLNITRLDSCFVDAACFVDGQINPSNECEVCVPLLDPLAWSGVSRGTACGNQIPDDLQCDSPDACNGVGVCEPNHKPAGIPCGDASDTDCDNPDTCDGGGLCGDNLEEVGFACGDPADTDCDNPDTCDGAGGCLDNLEASGTPCGDLSATACDNPDSCDDAGACLDNLAADGTPCPDGVFCNGDETCSSGVCVDNADPCVSLEFCDEANMLCFECLDRADCADVDMNGISDDSCFWYECVANFCNVVPRAYGDLGGEFGACPPDGVADNNDLFHALNCFSNQDTLGNPLAYPCEENPPAALNVDMASLSNPCCPDGVCDNNDAFAALNAFENNTTCMCPGACSPGPAPEGAVQVSGSTSLTLAAAAQRVLPGQQIQVHVRLDAALKDFRGYQLHVASRGGRRGQLKLVDMTILQRRDWVFAGAGGAWQAFNLSIRQMLAGVPGTGVSTREGAYLATLTFEASPDAAGTFVVDLLRDHPADRFRTFLQPTAEGAIVEITGTRPARITVGK